MERKEEIKELWDNLTGNGEGYRMTNNDNNRILRRPPTQWLARLP
jgi:hypothetical protein